MCPTQYNALLRNACILAATPQINRQTAMSKLKSDSSSDEKGAIPGYHAETYVDPIAKSSDAPDVKPLSPEAAAVDEKKLLRKVDLRLIPWLSLLYLISFLDVRRCPRRHMCITMSKC